MLRRSPRQPAAQRAFSQCSASSAMTRGWVRHPAAGGHQGKTGLPVLHQPDDWIGIVHKGLHCIIKGAGYNPTCLWFIRLDSGDAAETLQYLHRTTPGAGQPPAIQRPLRRPLPRYTSFYMPHPGQADCAIILEPAKPGWIALQGAACRCGPGDLAVYLPGMRHEWGAGRGPWEFLWMSLDGPLAESAARGPSACMPAASGGPAPRDLFMELLKCLRSPARGNRRSRAAA